MLFFRSRLAVTLFVSLLASFAQAGIYKYQDAQGRWHFTDKPPLQGKVERIDEEKSTAASSDAPAMPVEVGDERDLDARLNARFSPQSDIEKATLSVVTVQSRMGHGSGFFVSGQCHIVTNRHVVRPTTSTGYQQQESNLKNTQKRLNEKKRALNDERQRLKRADRSLSKHRAYVDGLTNNAFKQEEQRELEQYQAIYERDLRNYKQYKDELEQEERAFKKQTSEFSLDSSMANVARSFEVILKDNSKIKARLLRLSKNKDLALLHIENCRSPYLTPNKQDTLHQGQAIYSVGSPLGQRDLLTSGVITKSNADLIYIDAQILPGNSGGPLINSDGEYIGVNTRKLSRGSANNEGFGISIPAAFVERELGDLLPATSQQ